MLRPAVDTSIFGFSKSFCKVNISQHKMSSGGYNASPFQENVATAEKFLCGICLEIFVIQNNVQRDICIVLHVFNVGKVENVIFAQ